MSRVLGTSLSGVDGVAIEVEVRISSLLPRIDIVGLPEAAVRESGARVRAAIAATGQPFPDRRITVNLAPAGLRKGGAGLDLPIAVGILAASGAVEAAALKGLALIGELALDGRIRPVRGALALTLAARDAGCAHVVVPAGNAGEAALAPGVEVLVAQDLLGVTAHLQGTARLPRAEALSLDSLADAHGAHPGAGGWGDPGTDLSDVRGQEHAKRALEIAAAGEHALLLQGAPGSGKTMLARRLPGLLPALDFDEALEVTRIHGAAGQLGQPGSGSPIVARRPFRAPHHTASTAGLMGGGNPPGPGEVSLAHRGVLFLDELPEFERRTLDSLRQVLEQRRVVIARARASCAFPAHFQLVAAANPCPCGWYQSGRRDCRCDDHSLARYRTRVSGPLLDRLDLHVIVPPLAWSQLDGPPQEPASRSVRERVGAARRRQQKRGAGRGFRTNAELPDNAIDALVDATPDARRLLGRAVEEMGLSARAARRVLKVARTVADLGGDTQTGPRAIAEALGFHGVSGSAADR